MDNKRYTKNMGWTCETCGRQHPPSHSTCYYCSPTGNKIKGNGYPKTKKPKKED